MRSIQSVSPDQPRQPSEITRTELDLRTQIVGRGPGLSWLGAEAQGGRGQSWLICSGDDVARDERVLGVVWAFGQLQIMKWRNGGKGEGETQEGNDQGTSRVSGHSRMYVSGHRVEGWLLAASCLQLF